ncbi:hypothetical protein [Humidisolicoccus flavus]|uniref:hypothetical protein n=1 Tax=Humidisolicoccus flavus TaxID=3111414 RepID=UPI003252399B
MSVLDWLLDSDPSIRWQVLRDLTEADAAAVMTERTRIANEGFGRRLLDLRDSDGQWAGGAFFPAGYKGEGEGQPWTATNFALQQLRDFEIEPQIPEMQETIALIAVHSTWEHAGQAFFDGEVEPCINGVALANGAYFGANVHRIAERLVSEQLADGGWNCEAERGSVRSSFDTTICVLEGLLEYERSPSARRVEAIAQARTRAEEYLLDRHLMRRLSTGVVPDEGWLLLTYPPRWHYDILRGLDYLRDSGRVIDERMQEALALLRAKRLEDGSWPLEHRLAGDVHFEVDSAVGAPSRWNTLRALRVLRWAGE